MDDDFIEAIDATADTSFDASAPTNDANEPTNCNANAPTNIHGDQITCPVVLNLLAKPLFAARRSGIEARGFLDGERKSIEPEIRPPYLGPPSGRIPTDDEKRGAWQLQEEYLAGRLGKTMKSLGKTQGVGDGVAATVGRQRVIEGLRLAESIRKGLGRQDRPFSMWAHQVRARQIPVHRPGFSVDDTIKGKLAILADKSLPKPVRAPASSGRHLNQTAGSVIKLADKPLAVNDNYRFDGADREAA